MLEPHTEIERRLPLPGAVFFMRIGGVSLEISSNSPKLIATMATYYAEFSQPEPGPAGQAAEHDKPEAVGPAGQAAERVKIAIQWKNEAKIQHPFLPVITFGDQDIHYSAAGCRGMFDFGRAEAEITLDTPQPFERIEYFLRVIVAVRAYESGGFLFHGAGIDHQGRGVIFFGPSGTGKTTVSRNSPNDTVLNDDLVLLMPEGGDWIIHSTPFWNPTQVKPVPASVRLSGLFRLVQDKQVFCQKPTQAAALAEMAANIPVLCTDPRRGQAIIQRILKIMAGVPVYKLHFLPDDSFWAVVDAAL